MYLFIFAFLNRAFALLLQIFCICLWRDGGLMPHHFSPLVSGPEGTTFVHVRKPQGNAWASVTSCIFPTCSLQIYFPPFSTLLGTPKASLMDFTNLVFSPFACLLCSANQRPGSDIRGSEKRRRERSDLWFISVQFLSAGLRIFFNMCVSLLMSTALSSTTQQHS